MYWNSKHESASHEVMNNLRTVTNNEILQGTNTWELELFNFERQKYTIGNLPHFFDKSTNNFER
jgi:hypothetical protein